MKRKPIKDQVVVIVGATSGIGRETALKFAAQGARVVVSGRSQDALNELVLEIEVEGGLAAAFAADASDYAQMEYLARQSVDRFGRIDTWVHLAAVTVYATFEDTRPEEFRQVIEVNLLGQIFGAKAALPYMLQQGSGALIHVSSAEAKRALPYQSAYSASKHGLVGFLDALRMELEHDGYPITVTNVMPASMNTPLFDKALTRLGVKPRPVPPVYEPGLAADGIIYAAEHPVRDLYIGGAGKGLSLLQKVSPRLADKALAGMGFRTQRSDQPKDAGAPSNLFEHLPGYDTIEGELTGEALPAAAYPALQKRPVLRWAALGALTAAGIWVARRGDVRPWKSGK